MISHWDDVDSVRREQGHICGDWQSLTGDASDWIGVKRIRVAPERWSTPLHLEGAEEEIFFVLGGTGLSLQRVGATEGAYEVGPGDCLVHLALVHAHTLQAGTEGLEVLAFGERSYAANTLLPRAGVSWLGPTWVLEGAPDDHPWAREERAGPPEVGEPAARPQHIVNVSAMEGQFYRTTKTDKHPHTNMAKAALNMLTRTSAPDFVKDGIHMNAVDTGWVTDEDPAVHAARKAEAGFAPPLDIIDGAARIRADRTVRGDLQCAEIVRDRDRSEDVDAVRAQEQLRGSALHDDRPGNRDEPG